MNNLLNLESLGSFIWQMKQSGASADVILSQLTLFSTGYRGSNLCDAAIALIDGSDPEPDLGIDFASYTQVKRFGYRSAQPDTRFFSFRRSSHFGRMLEQHCLHYSKSRPDNHVCFQLWKMEGGDSITFLFHDDYVIVGTGIAERRW